MVDNKYAKAYTEVVELLSALPEEELKQIPSEELEFYKENMDKDYVFSINPDVDLTEQNISFEANNIIIDIFQKYFATENQNEMIEQILERNTQEAEALKREKYNPDNIFKSEETSNIKIEEINENSVIKEDETSLTNTKESIFSKIKSFILKLFNKEK